MAKTESKYWHDLKMRRKTHVRAKVICLICSYRELRKRMIDQKLNMPTNNWEHKLKQFEVNQQLMAAIGHLAIMKRPWLAERLFWALFK